MKTMTLLAALLALAAGPSQATVFESVVAEKSMVNFVARQMGVSLEGGFKKFSVQVTFDPGKPETGKAQIEIDLSSIDTGSSDANDEVKGKAWFNLRDYPTAKFVASGVKPLGANRFEASGKMTIKGKTRDVVAPFTTKVEAGALLIDGSIPILRLQYGVGDGVWADTATVADEVQVRFHLTLTAAPSKKK
ncbi:MAG: YceI family protein [Sterolibacterium sp.]